MIDALFRGPDLDCDVLALDIAVLLQTLAEAFEAPLPRGEDEPPDHRHIRPLFRAGRQCSQQKGKDRAKPAERTALAKGAEIIG